MSSFKRRLNSEDGSAMKIGDKITEFNLPAIDGSRFTLEQVRGKRYMLSFMRFAGCPFCHLRIHHLIDRWGELNGNFTVIAVFDSSQENLRKHAENRSAPFFLLADEHGVYYRKFAVKRSLWGVFKAVLRRLPTLLYAMFVKQYIPTSIKGKITTLPVDYLVDEKGVIVYAHRGKDAGDHLPFDRVKAFA
ncbi:MAG: peroxiredoxin family protein, partial [Gammaproteobacteria bacterium]